MTMYYKCTKAVYVKSVAEPGVWRGEVLMELSLGVEPPPDKRWNQQRPYDQRVDKDHVPVHIPRRTYRK